MDKYLALIKNSLIKQNQSPKPADTASDIDIISCQADLMSAGGITFQAMKSGELAEILVGLVALAYVCAEQLVLLGVDEIEVKIEPVRAYQLFDVMRLLSEKIHTCSSGKAADYIALNVVCSRLSTDFLNADFDKAFRQYHEYRIAQCDSEDKTTQNKDHLPDLSDCLYE